MDIVCYDPKGVKSKVLHQVSSSVDLEDVSSTEELPTLLSNMVEAMKKSHGSGLAAPQVGIGKRLLIADGSTQGLGILKLINPEIVDRSSEMVTYNEGCLSIPGLVIPVLRHKELTLKAYTEGLSEVVIVAEEMLAVIFQHEMDHLDGILTIDKVGPIKRDMYKKKILKSGYPVKMPRAYLAHIHGLS